MRNYRRLSFVCVGLLISAVFVSANAYSLSPPSPPPSPTVTFQAAPETITMGEASTLSWTSTGDSTTIDGTPVNVDGNMDVSPAATTTYNLSSTASDNNGTSEPATAQVTVTVQYAITSTSGPNGTVTPLGTLVFNSGANQLYSFTPDTGYQVADVVVDGSSQGARDRYEFTGISANHSISVSFERISYTVTTSAGPNGTVSPSGTIPVNHGDDLSVQINPDTGYTVSDVVVDGTSVGPLTRYDFNGITANRTLTASFTPITYTITATAGANGTVTPSGSNTVNHGDTLSVSISPDTGYSIGDVLVDGSSVGPVSSYEFTNVTSNHTLETTYTINRYDITTSAELNGTVSPSGTTSVAHGEDFPVTITPDAGYSITDVVVDGLSVGPVSTYLFPGVKRGHTLTASFGVTTYTVTTSAGANGIVSPLGDSMVNHGDNFTVSILPDTGYAVSDVVVDGLSVGAVPEYEFTVVETNHTLHASFDTARFTINASAGPNGSISPVGDTQVDYGSSFTVSITPDTGYSIEDVLVDGISVGAVESYNFTNITENHTVRATFVTTTFDITTTAGAGGTVSPPGVTTVAYGGSQEVIITPDTGYSIEDVLVDGVSEGPVARYEFTNVTKGHTLHATFVINTYTVTATAGVNGSVTPSGAISVDHGNNLRIDITPDSGYVVDDVLVDGLSVGAVSSHEFVNVTSGHTIHATFTELNTTFTVTTSAGDHGTVSPLGSTVVNSGSNLTVTMIPDTGYSVETVLVDGVDEGAVVNYEFTNIIGDHSLSASFIYTGYQITATSGPNGSISSSGTTIYNSGDSPTYFISPNTGYRVADVVVDGVSQGSVSSYTFPSTTTDHTIHATFEILTYTVTTSAGQHGSVTPSGATSVSYGGSLLVTITPDAGYGISDVLVNGVSVGKGSSYEFTNVTSDQTLSAGFVYNGATITATAGANGTITPFGATDVNIGDSLTYTITPDTGYSILDVQVDGASVGAVSSYTFTNITGNHSIAATFRPNDYTITASAGPNGTIDPEGAVGVTHGSSQAFNIIPDTGYSVFDVVVNGGSVGAVTFYEFTSIDRDSTISASFEYTGRTVTATAGANGTITPAGATIVNTGDSLVYTITPDTGYGIADVLVDGTSVGAVERYTFPSITEDHTIDASFEIITFSVNATSGDNGAITPAGVTTVNYGEDLTVTITPDTGYRVLDVTVDGSSVGAVETYTLTNVTSGHSIHAEFEILTNTITATAGLNGSVSPAGATPVNYGGSITITITPDTGYRVSDVLVDGVSVGAVTSYSFTSVTSDRTLQANFSASIFTITSSAGEGGSISPIGETFVNYGAALTLSITPDAGYVIDAVTVDGEPVGVVYEYTFSDITKNHTIHVDFRFEGASVTATAGVGGTVTPGGETRLELHDVLTISIQPEKGYIIGNVMVDGVSQGSLDSYTFSGVTENHTLHATFAFIGSKVVASAGEGGTIFPNATILVDNGDDLTLTITPDTGYDISDVSVDGESVGAESTYTFTDITSDHLISATFELTGKTVTATAGTGGAISPEGTALYNLGDTVTYTITPDTGYRILDVTVDGVSEGMVDSYTFTAVAENHTINVSFEYTGATITASAGEHGSVSPSGITVVNMGESLTIDITPDPGYEISNLIVDGIAEAAATSYTFTDINGDHTLSAEFSLNGVVVTTSAGEGGSVTPQGATAIDTGGSLTVMINPDSGYRVLDVLVNGASAGGISEYTFINVVSDQTLSATFEFIGRTVTTTAGPGGTVTPLGDTHVDTGDSLSVSIVPDEGYVIDAVFVDGVSQGDVERYRFENITVDHALDATFKAIPVFTVSGNVSMSGTNLSGVTLTLSGDGGAEILTDNSGNYLFTDIKPGEYVITPSVNGYAFVPLAARVTITDQDIPNIDFQAIAPWAGIKQFGSDRDDEAWSCHEDADGNVYVTGKTLGGVGGNINMGGYDVYVKKYNASGISLWTVQIGSDQSDYVYGITTDSTGNVYVAGDTTGDVSGTNAGDQDIFIAKFTGDGSHVWTMQTGTSAGDFTKSICSDMDDNIYITGYTYGDLGGSGNIGGRDAFAMKYASDGTQLWVDQQGTRMDEEAWAAVASASGELYVTGYTEFSIAGLPHTGHRDIFICKYSGSGEIQWIEGLGSEALDAATSIAVSDSGDVYVGGHTKGDIDGFNNGFEDYLIAKFDPTGTLQWVRQAGSPGKDSAMGITVFGEDEIYIGGYTEGEPGGNTSAGLKDLFVAKYNSNGDEQWVSMAGTAKNDLGVSLSSRSPDSVFIAGYTTGRFDGGKPNGSSDAFVIKYNGSGELQGELNTLETVDGNNDTILDVAQENVESFYSYDDLDIITIETPEGTTLEACKASAVPAETPPPSEAEFPYGMYDFRVENVVPGASSTATIYLPEGSAPTTYYKYGPTPEDDSDHWYEFLYDGTTGAVIEDNVITLHFVDGERGDNDLDDTNGIIVDPGAPGVPVKVSGSSQGPTTVETSKPESGGGGGGGGGCFIDSLTR